MDELDVGRWDNELEDVDEFDEDIYDDEFEGMSLEEKRELFFDLSNRIGKLDADEKCRLGSLSNSLIGDSPD